MQIAIGSIRHYFQSFQHSTQENSELTPAAVLILLFKKNDQLHVILTKRTDRVKNHKGQISFPGGTKDSADMTIIDTALRETEEEIGLTRDTVEILGMLNDFCTPSGFCITPIVGLLTAIPSFILNKTEVSEIFNVPLSFFLDSRNERMEQHERSGKMTNMYFYRYGKYEIWGVTAAILRSFLIGLGTQKGQKKTL